MEIEGLDDSVSSSLIIELRKRTGLPLVACKSVLKGVAPALRQQFVEFQRGSYMKDPIEGDPIVAPLLESLYQETNAIIEAEHQQHIADIEKTSPDVAAILRPGRGLCYRQWSMVKRLLKERHGVDWKSSAELNPWTRFD